MYHAFATSGDDDEDEVNEEGNIGILFSLSVFDSLGSYMCRILPKAV